MTRAAIISALIRFARKIGRWILRKLLEIGADWLRGYLAGKIDDFGRRLARAKAAIKRAKTDAALRRARRRHRRIAGRIERWSDALQWINLHHPAIVDDIVREADDAAGSIPMVAAAEREAA